MRGNIIEHQMATLILQKDILEEYKLIMELVKDVKE